MTRHAHCYRRHTLRVYSQGSCIRAHTHHARRRSQHRHWHVAGRTAGAPLRWHILGGRPCRCAAAARAHAAVLQPCVWLVTYSPPQTSTRPPPHRQASFASRCHMHAAVALARATAATHSCSCDILQETLTACRSLSCSASSTLPQCTPHLTPHPCTTLHLFTSRDITLTPCPCCSPGFEWVPPLLSPSRLV